MSADSLPPSDLDAERAVLASVLVSPDALDDAKSVITSAEQFFYRAHQFMWTAIIDLDDEAAPVDPTSVANRLRANGDLDKAGGTPAIAEVLNAPVVSQVTYHAETIVDLHLSRTVIDHCRRFAIEGRQQVNPRKWASEVADEIQDSIPEKLGLDDGSIRDLMQAIRSDIDARRNGNPTGEAVPTGFRALDEALGGGMYRGNLYIGAARPGMGKTALGVQVAHNCARSDFAALFLGLEMPNRQVASRQLSIESGVSVIRLLGSRLSGDENAKVIEASSNIARLPIAFDDCSGLTVGGLRTKLRRRVRKLRAEHGDDLRLGVIVIDYVQKIKARHMQNRSRDNELGEISEGCRLLAREFDAPVLLLCQLNREVEKRPNKRPQLSDLRESGSLEQDAYAVLGLYRDEYYYGDKSEEPNIAEVIVLKHRNGPTGTVKLAWRSYTSSFSNLSSSFDDEFGDMEPPPDYIPPDFETPNPTTNEPNANGEQMKEFKSEATWTWARRSLARHY